MYNIEVHQLRNILTVVLGGIETNDKQLAIEAIRKADNLLTQLAGKSYEEVLKRLV